MPGDDQLGQVVADAIGQGFAGNKFDNMEAWVDGIQPHLLNASTMQPAAASNTSTAITWAWAATSTSNRCLQEVATMNTLNRHGTPSRLPGYQLQHTITEPDHGFQCTENSYLDMEDARAKQSQCL